MAFRISHKAPALRRIEERFLLPLLLVAVVIIQYEGILQSFWLVDDTQILKHAISNPHLGYFFIPGSWQKLSWVNLTPWVSLSFYLDWKIFGLDPFWFYLHHLISLCALLCVAFACLRLWFSAKPVFFGLLLFAVSPPFAGAAQFLMVRHYIEGLIFSLVSFYFFVKAVRGSNGIFAVTSAFFYLLACSAKELYVPLPFLFLFVPESDLRSRAAAARYCLGISAFYVLWRWFMLGKLLGGYGARLGLDDAYLFLPRIARGMAGSSVEGIKGWWLWLLTGSSLIALAGHFPFDRKKLALIAITCVLVLLPVFPVSQGMASRFVWVVCFCWVVLHISAWDRLMRVNRFFTFVVPGWILLITVGFFSQTAAAVKETSNLALREGMEGSFFLKQGGESDLLVNPILPVYYYDGLSWLRREVLHRTEGPGVLADTRFICLEERLRTTHPRIWYFDSARRGLVSEGVDAFRSRICTRELLKSVRENAPLSVRLEYDAGVAAWSFGPYEDGKYDLLLGAGAGDTYVLPPHGRSPISLQDSLVRFRIRYSSPEGWLAYSPLLELKITSGQGSVRWDR